MHKLKQLSASSFLRLLFAAFTFAFLCSAFIAPDRAEMFTGLRRIMTESSKVSTNYFDNGGYAGTFLNAGLVCLVLTALYSLPKVKVNATSCLGLSADGRVLLLGRQHPEPLVRLPRRAAVLPGQARKSREPDQRHGLHDRHLPAVHGPDDPLSPCGCRRLPLAGHPAGHCGRPVHRLLPAAGLVHSPKMHKGYDLYSAAVPVGLTAFFVRALPLSGARRHAAGGA